MLCPECEARGLRTRPRDAGEQPARGAEAPGTATHRRCTRCGRAVPAPDPAHRLLEKLARLDAFGLAPSAGPLFAVDGPPPER